MPAIRTQMSIAHGFKASSRKRFVAGIPLALQISLIASPGLVLALGLWSYYGTTVFFEIVRSGWAGCG